MYQAILHIHQLILQGASVCTDSRHLKPGNIFFALKGEKFDGNLFAHDALDKGAEIVVVDGESFTSSGKILKVESVLQTLQQLANYHREQFTIPVIGITGSNGKTTTKELINAVLSKKYRTLCTLGNFNNHIGVPLTLLRLKDEHEMAIIEMGANHMGEIALLSSIANPNYGLITNVGKAHIEGFGSAENIVIGKTELYRHLHSKGGTIFINSGNEKLMKHTLSCPLITYSAIDNGSVQGIIISTSPFLEISYTLQKSGFQNTVKTQLTGAYNLENILAAVAIGDYFGVDHNDIRQAIEEYSPNNSRSQLKTTAKNTLILDAYNANPTSMKAALESFAAYSSPLPKVAILGDMLELGHISEYEHQEIVRLAESLKFEIVILIGPLFLKTNTSKPTFYKFKDNALAFEWMKENPLKNRLIFLKGSRGIKVEILETLL